MDCSPPGSSVHWILQVKIWERVSMPSSRGSHWPRDGTLVSYISCHAGRFSTINATCAVCLVYVWATMCLVAHSCVWLSVTPQTAVLQAPLLMGFFRQEYWSGLPFPTPGDLPNPGIESVAPALASGFFNTEPPWKVLSCYWRKGSNKQT